MSERTAVDGAAPERIVPDLVPDAEQRQRALDPQLSIICEAPAGSGKTELLTQRFLCLLARVQKPEEILAITFTRKAAGEMRERILGALHKARLQPEPELAHERATWTLAQQALAQDKKLRWQINDNPNRLQIKTFDSVSAGLANALPWHSSFASPPQVVDDANEPYLSAVRTLLDSLEGDHPWTPALATVLSLLDNNTQKLEALLVSILARREAWLPLLGSGADGEEAAQHLHQSLASVCEDNVAKLNALLAPQQTQQLLDLVAFSASQLAASDHPLEACLNLNLVSKTLPQGTPEGVIQWQSIARLCLTNDLTWRKTVNKNNGFPPGENAEEKRAFKEKKVQFMALLGDFKNTDGLLDALVDVVMLPSLEYDEDQEVLLTALFQVLPVLSGLLTLEFREKNCVDFSEISMRANDALGELDAPSELALALDYKIHHILVDEFQDTSPAQIKLLKHLTAGWELGDGRTLFCVGDAMQSIYGFRGANVGLFLNCLQNGLGGIALVPIKLSTNFRSQAGVVDWVNRVFHCAFPRRSVITDGAVQYSPSTAFTPALPGAAVTVHGIDPEASQGLDVEGVQARQVVSLVKQSLQMHPEGKTAILVRSRKHASYIALALQSEGIRFRAVDLEPLLDYPVVQDLMALTQALLEPSNRVAWLAILRAPWCGLSLHDLEVIATSGPAHATLWQQLLASMSAEPATLGLQHSNDQASLVQPRLLSADARQRLARVVPVLREALANTHRKALRQWVAGTWIALGGPACVDSEASLKNAEVFFDLLEKHDDGSAMVRRDVLEKSLEKLFAAPDPEADDRIQIMTIHKSKGLEFDTVILPSLNKEKKSPEPELLRWYERVSSRGEDALVLAPIKVSGKKSDAIVQHVMHQEKKKEAHEACRLLYVACTRAKQHLHLLASLARDPEKGWKVPKKNALLAPIFDSVKLAIRLVEPNSIESIPTENSPTENSPEQIDFDSAAEPLALQNNNDHVAYDQTLFRLNSQWQSPALPEKHLLDAFVPFYSHTDATMPSPQWEDPSARHVGTLSHHLLHMLASQGWSDSMLDAQLQSNKWRGMLANMGVPIASLDAAVSQVITIANSLRSDQNLQWMLKEQHQTRRSEFPISLVNSDGSVAQLAIDLLLADANITWVIDYKTSAPAPGQRVEDFIADEKRRYAESMKRYVEAVEQLGYPQVRAALYFPLIAHWGKYDTHES